MIAQMYTHKKMKTTEESLLGSLDREFFRYLEAQEDYSNDALYADTLCILWQRRAARLVMYCGRSVQRFPVKQMTPAGATEIMEIIGKEESLKRIRTGIALLTKALEK